MAHLSETTAGKAYQIALVLALIGLFVGVADGLFRYVSEGRELGIVGALLTKVPGWMVASLLIVPLFHLVAWVRAYRERLHTWILAGGAVICSAALVIVSATMVTQIVRGREISWNRTPGILFEELDRLLLIASFGFAGLCGFFYMFLEFAESRGQRLGTERKIRIKTGREVHVLPERAIDGVTAAGNYVVVHAGGSEHLTRRSMKQMQRHLDPERFMRIHRSAIVRVDAVEKLDVTATGRDVAVTAGGTAFPLSREHKETLLERITYRY